MESRSKINSPENLLTLTSRKREFLGLPAGKVNANGGVDWIRELVRMRDNHTCQSCGKIWETGKRRFDVHHLNGLCGKMAGKRDKIENLPNMVTLCHKCHFNHSEHAIRTRKMDNV